MNPAFIAGEVLTSLRRNASMVVSVVLVTFVSLTFVGAGILLQMQIGNMKSFWYDRVEVSVFLCQPNSPAANCAAGAVTDQQRDAVRAALESGELSQYVSQVFYESQQDAFRNFQQQFEGTSLEGSVGETDLPESFRVKLDNPEQYQIIADFFASTPGVDSVTDQRAALEPLFAVMNIATALAIAIAVLMLVTAVLLVGTTIRLSAQMRSESTGIMRLVGASNSTIQLPFVLEGIIAAALGSALSVLALWLIVQFFVQGWVADQTAGITLVDGANVLVVAPILLGLGILLAAIASIVTLRRYLKV